MNLLDVEDLSVFSNKNCLIKNVSFSLSQGDWFMIIGPNGSGKSSLIKGIMGDLETKGNVIFQGEDFHKFNNKEKALRIGVLSQKINVTYAFTVKEIVELGLFSQSKGFFDNKIDSPKVDEILIKTNLYQLKDRNVLTLSGGELQRVFLAQTFLQNPDILILDEPVNNLDINYQKEIFDLIKEWLKKENKGVISVIHDLNIASTFATKAMLIKNSQVLAYGDKENVFSSKNLNLAYGIDVRQWLKSINDLI